jgi:DNA primase
METREPGEIPERYGFRKAFEAVKAEVCIEQYLSDQGVEMRGGRARCPIHKGDSLQSFAVYLDKGRWHCFRCNEGGDVIDLACAVEGGELWEAMVSLAQRYNVTLPEKSERWRTWQNEKGRIREAAKKHTAGVYLRRLTRVYAPLVLLGGEKTPEEELQELKELSSSLWPTALDLAGKRVRGEE